MIAALRAEEKADIEHRDWCEAQTKAANSKNENLEYDKEQLDQKKQRAEDKKAELEKEIKTARAEEAEDLAAYEKLREDNTAAMNALEEKKVTLGQDIAGKMKEISEIEAVLGDKDASKKATDDLLESLKPNCDWISRTFDTRMEKRKAEMEGLANAKSVLAGAAPDAAMVATQRRAGHGSVDDELKALDSSERKFEKSFLQRA